MNKLQRTTEFVRAVIAGFGQAPLGEAALLEVARKVALAMPPNISVATAPITPGADELIAGPTPPTDRPPGDGWRLWTEDVPVIGSRVEVGAPGQPIGRWVVSSGDLIPGAIDSVGLLWRPGAAPTMPKPIGET